MKANSVSLPFFKLQRSLEKEIQNFWGIAVASEFSKAWIDQNKVGDAKLTSYFGHISPYSYVDISGNQFKKGWSKSAIRH